MIRDHELAFYDRYLRDEGNDWEERPPLELFVLGRNEWRGESEWPLPGTEFTPFFLRSGGRLDRDVPRSDEPADRYAYDPEDPVPTIGGVNSVLTMTQGARAADPPRPVGPARARGARRRARRTRATSSTRDLEVIGPVEMVLFAASSAKDTDFFVRVCDVYPDGRSIFLTEGIIRARYRELARGRQHRAARAGRGRRVPDPLLPDGERLRARPPDPRST